MKRNIELHLLKELYNAKKAEEEKENLGPTEV